MKMPGAELRLLPPGVNHSTGGMGAIHGVIVHVIVGSLAAADGAFHKPSWNASAHFGVGKDGHIVQWVDTADKAWAEAAGNPNWISVETEGLPSEALTDAQITACAAIVKWAHDTHGGFSLQVTDNPSGYGVGTHEMGGAAWGGHACPGGIRAGQRSEIVRRATAVAPNPPEDAMGVGQPFHFTKGGQHFIAAWPFKHIVTPQQAADYKTLRIVRDEPEFELADHIYNTLHESQNALAF